MQTDRLHILKYIMHSFFYQFNDTEQLFCNGTERHKRMGKAEQPFLSFFIKLGKARDCFEILKERKKQLLDYETTT